MFLKWSFHILNTYSCLLGWLWKNFAVVATQPYRKASSRGAYGHDPFWSVFEEHRLDFSLQQQYLYHRCHCTIWSCGIKWIFFKNTSKRIMSICASGRGFTVCARRQEEWTNLWVYHICKTQSPCFTWCSMNSWPSMSLFSSDWSRNSTWTSWSTLCFSHISTDWG